MPPTTPSYKSAPDRGKTKVLNHARLVFVILPGVEAHAVEEPHRSHKALLRDVDHVWGLKPVRKVDAQLARKGLQRAQGSCHPCRTKGLTNIHLQYIRTKAQKGSYVNIRMWFALAPLRRFMAPGKFLRNREIGGILKHD